MHASRTHTHTRERERERENGHLWLFSKSAATSELCCEHFWTLCRVVKCSTEPRQGRSGREVNRHV